MVMVSVAWRGDRGSVKGSCIGVYVVKVIDSGCNTSEDDYAGG